MQRRSPPKHRHDGTSPLPLGMDWSPPPRKWNGRDTVWPHDPHTGWSYCVTIPSWVVRPKSRDSDPVVFYRVQVGVQSPEGVTTTRGVLRRFNDFLKLFTVLKKAFPKKNLPPAPPKGLLRMKTRALLEERRCSLEEWMIKLLSDIDIARSVAVASFLELEAAARFSFQDVNQQNSEASPASNITVSSIQSIPNSSLPIVAGSSLFTSDYGSDTAYETSELGTPRLGRDDNSEIGLEDLTLDEDLTSPIEKLVKYGMSNIDEGLFMGHTILEQLEGLPRHKMNDRHLNNVIEKDKYNGNSSKASFLVGNGMELFSGPEHGKVIDHVRKLSNESFGSDVSSLRGSEMSNSGIPNSSGDGSLDLPGGLVVVVRSFLLCLFSSQIAAAPTGIPSLRPRLPNDTLCNHLILPAGYPCSEHTVQTKDGYLLALHRVSSRTGNISEQRGPPVLLQHGLFMAGDAWFLDSPEQSLGFILADHGFDVWVGNVRGTRWSHGHVSLSEKDKDFWDWSWQELALHDLADMICYINTITNTKIFFVGHSQGTIMSLAAFTQPDIVEMVEAAALLCPISYLGHVSAPFVLRMVNMHLDQMILAMGVHELNFRSDWGINLIDSICDGHVDCNDLLSSITGKNCCFNNSRVDFYLEYEPHPSSSKNLRHLFQMIRKGTFSKYDYGLFKNLKIYGQLKPPIFDLGHIPKSLPLWISYGGNDDLADVTDLQHTLKELQSKPELLYLENYGHVDFLLSVNAKKDVYDHMIRFFRSWGKSSSSY